MPIVSLKEAQELLLHEEVVAIPTETVYGLAARFNCPEAISKIFTLKNRPQDNPLILHAHSLETILSLTCSLPSSFYLLAKAFWPGPLTLVVPANQELVPAIVRANLPTLGVRIPHHPLTLSLLEKTGPLVAPSANLSGRPSPTTAQHVMDDLGPNFPVLDGGQALMGLESTILIWKEDEKLWEMGRLGALSASELEPILGYAPKAREASEKALCPGSKYRHYAPLCKLHEGNLSSTYSGAIVGFSDRSYPKSAQLFLLGPSTSAEICSHNLYKTLRQLDKEKIKEAWVDTQFSSEGLWATLQERIKKAMIAN